MNRLPPHKTLFHTPPGKGLPIGNLNSQFFANVYLNALDQFVKHELKCRWYLRYCDDFVLLARSSDELHAWKTRIEQFVEEQLDLRLNETRERLRPVGDGVDFLGYIVRPFHLLVRRRVVGHLREALQQSQCVLVHQHDACTEYRFEPETLDLLQARLASYLGHLRRAACHRLVASIWAAHPWLKTFVVLDRTTLRLRHRDQPPTAAKTVLAQYRHWREAFPDDLVLIQVGAFFERLQWPPRRLASRARAGAKEGAVGLRRMRPTSRGAIEGFPLSQLQHCISAMLATGRNVTVVSQHDTTGGGIMQRLPQARWVGLKRSHPES